MKRTLSKLHLHRETLRHLQNPELVRVRAGTAVATVACPTKNNACDLTCDLCVTGNCS